ncbi:hypothetical protein IYC_04233 [Clostridium sporogenes PA 3679]|nr:hypothetical protein IYC_04233 [Clostridium sporogenes PA 3679]
MLPEKIENKLCFAYRNYITTFIELYYKVVM